MMHHERQASPQEGLAGFARTLNALIAKHPLQQVSDRGRPGAGARLARVIQADETQVRRWLRGKRLPPRDAIPKISEALALSEEETRRLELSFALARQSLTPSSIQEGAAAASDLAALARPIQSQAHTSSIDRLSPSVNSRLPRAGAVISDLEELAQVIIRLLARACQLETPGTIYITFSGSKSLMDVAHRQARFQAVVRECLRNGWTLNQVIRLDENDITRTVSHVVVMLSYLGISRSRDDAYQPSFLKNGASLVVPYDVVVVPGVGALICFAIQQPDHLDAGIFLTDPDQLELLAQHVNQLSHSPQAGKFLRSFRLYEQAGESDFSRALADLERSSGGRFVMKLDGLSAITRPASYYHADSSFMRWRPVEERTRRAQAMYDRWQSFERLVSRYPYRDVCARSSIRRFARDGTFARDDTDLTGVEPERRTASVPQRREHLTHTIRLLDAFPNFRIALVDEDEEKRLQHTAQWEAVGESGVALEVTTYDAQGRQTLTELQITEPGVVRAFQAYGDQIWESIAPANRDRDRVIAFLREELEKLG